MTQPSLVWFRQDLRLEDQPALRAAIARGEPVIPVYILSPGEDGDWPPGAASRWWLHQSLTRLSEQLAALGSRLIIRRGDTLRELLSLIDETEAAAMFWTRRYEPSSIGRDARVKTELRLRGLAVESFNGQLLFEPWEVQTKEGRPYQVFTPFWKSCLTRPQPDAPEPAPEQIRSPDRWPVSLSVEELELKPTIRWDSGLKSAWQPGEMSAKDELHRFLESRVFDYGAARDRPAERGTSRLSPHLHFGEISPRTIWHEIQRVLQGRPPIKPRPVSQHFSKKSAGASSRTICCFISRRPARNRCAPSLRDFPGVTMPRDLPPGNAVKRAFRLSMPE